jgi:hypothetical protein
MTKTLSSVTFIEVIILGGRAGVDWLAGVRSTILARFNCVFKVILGIQAGIGKYAKRTSETEFRKRCCETTGNNPFDFLVTGTGTAHVIL